MEIPEHLRIRPGDKDIKRWCIVRYNGWDRSDGISCCGPLALNEFAPGRIGFPDGWIGPEVLTFDSAGEAQKFLDDSPGQPSTAIDVVELVASQVFVVEVYNGYNCTKIRVYEGNDLLKVRSAYFEQVGRKAITKDRYLEVRIDINRDYYVDRCETAPTRCKIKPENSGAETRADLQ